jgi:hypothetical protein
VTNDNRESSASSKLITLAAPLILLATAMPTVSAADSSSVKDRLDRVRAAIAAQANNQPGDPSVPTYTFRNFADAPNK